MGNTKSKYDYEPVSSESVTYFNEKCQKCKIVNNKYQHIVTCPKCPLTMQCYDCEWNQGMVINHKVNEDNCLYYKKYNWLYCFCPCMRGYF